MPIQYGKKEGMFIQFHSSGKMAVRGRYEFDKKVGIWEEFYDLPGAFIVKREIQYPPDPFQKDFKSFIRKEFNKRGREIYVSPHSR